MQMVITSHAREMPLPLARLVRLRGLLGKHGRLLRSCRTEGGRGMTDEEKAEVCYECSSYGDDYYIDKNGNLVCACADCWVNRECD